MKLRNKSIVKFIVILTIFLSNLLSFIVPTYAASFKSSSSYSKPSSSSSSFKSSTSTSKSSNWNTRFNTSNKYSKPKD